MAKFDTEIRLSREMGVMDVTLIGVGAMIGAGIFVLTGIAAGVAGPALIITFALNGVVALFTAMSYAELGSCYHDAGGGYLWVKEGLPKWNGFLSGWMSWFAHAVACSLYAIGFGAYFDHVLTEIGIEVPHWSFLSPEKLLAAVVAILFAYINFRGASETGKIGNIVTVTKIVILAVFIAFGVQLIWGRGDWKDAFQPFMPNGWGGVFKAMGLTFIAFQGFEVISQCSEEIKNPKKNIPKAVFLSLIIVIPIYLLVAVTALGAVQPEGMTPWDYLASHKEIALVEVAKTFFTGGGIMLLVGGLISTMSALNATVYSSSRVAFAMGRDRNFPTFFSRVHSKNFTPHWAILFSSFLIILMAVSLPIEDVASAADIMFLLLFLQVNLAMIRLRKKRPDLDRGFVTPLFPILSMVGIALLLFLAIYMFNYSPIAWIVTLTWIGIGLVIYRVYAAKREVKFHKKVDALERLEQKEYRILVCLSDPRGNEGLLHTAFAVARLNNAEIIFLTVIEVREDKPLRAGLEDETSAGELLQWAMQIAVTNGVAARAIVKVAHRVSVAVKDTADEESCNFVFLGRARRPRFDQRIFASVMDDVISEAPWESAVLQGSLRKENVKTVLVPFGTDVHSKLALDMSDAFSRYFNAKLRVLLVGDAEREENYHERLELAQRWVRAAGSHVELATEAASGILAGLNNHANGDSLLIMGDSAGDSRMALFGQSLSQEIVEQTESPILWIREFEEMKSFWVSLLQPLKREE